MNVIALMVEASRNLGWGKGPWNVEQFGVLVAVLVCAAKKWEAMGSPRIKPTCPKYTYDLGGEG